MTVRNFPPAALGLALIAGIAAASYAPVSFLWSVNQLQFLPLRSALPIVAGLLILAATLFSVPEIRLKPALKQLDGLLFGPHWWPRVLFALLPALLAFIVPERTHFVGDGFELIGSMGRNQPIVYKWTGIGSLAIIRGLQFLMGEVSPETSRRAMILLSIGLGPVTWLCLIAIIRRLVDTPAGRLLSLFAVIFGGSMTLFLGHIEFYSMLWASGAATILLIVRALQTRKGAHWAVMATLVAAVIHVQAIILLPGALLAVAATAVRGKKPDTTLRPLAWILGSGMVICFLAAHFLASSFFQLRIWLLPFLPGSRGLDTYAVFTLRHFGDILNLFLLICPGLLILLILRPWRQINRFFDVTATSLGLMAVGGGLFILGMDPAFGMPRDFDLMSFSVLPVALYLLYRIVRLREGIPGRAVVVALVVSLAVLVPSVAVSYYPPAGERRARAWLELNGTKNKTGWVTLANYFGGRRQRQETVATLARMGEIFPEELMLTEARKALESGQYPKVFAISNELIRRYPLEANYLQLHGNALGKLGRFAEADTFYLRSIALRPVNAPLRNEYGQLLIIQGRVAEAKAEFYTAIRADQTFLPTYESLSLAHIHGGEFAQAMTLADTLAARGSLGAADVIRLAANLEQGLLDQARRNFTSFRFTGKGRSDYSNIIEHYGYLDTLK